MEQGILTDLQEKDPDMIREIVENFISRKGYNNIRANVGDYETPAKLTRRVKGEEESFIPDATATLNGRKSYFEVSLKTDNTRPVVTKWKLLSNLASMKNGKFFLLVPRGHMAFTNRILSRYPMEAEIIKLY